MSKRRKLFSTAATEWAQCVTAVGTAVLEILGPSKSEMTTRQWLLWGPASKMSWRERDMLWSIEPDEEEE